MKPTLLRTNLLLLLAGATIASGPATVATAQDSADAVIAKARAFLGGDAALDAIRSIRFVGTIIMQDGKNGDIEILVRRPMQQRVTITIGNLREITALSDYDGWRRVENLLVSTDWELTLLDAPQIQRLRANTIENIGFFKGIDHNQPEVQLIGEETVGGVDCLKVSFNHAGRVKFVRSFNKETGQLLRTETDDGGALTERGEIYVQGVRFPKELITRTPAGTSTVVFTRISLNETLADNLFDVPLLIPGKRQ
jgi:hypothetical protein